MKTYSVKPNRAKRSASNTRESSEPLVSMFTDNRPEGVTQRKLQEAADNSPQIQRLARLQTIANGHRQVSRLDDKPDHGSEKSGLPDHLKAGIETLSGIAMDDVNVHTSSSKPARLQALAYTRGTDIHVAAGQEEHLSHEAWHVVQQKQGRVRSTLQTEGVGINDDQVLEREADVMGAEASNMRSSDHVDRPLAAATQPLTAAPIQMVDRATRATEGQLSLRNAAGDETAKIAGEVTIDVDKSTVVALDSQEGAKAMYKIDSVNGRAQNQTEAYDTSDLYIAIDDLNLSTSEVIADAVANGPRYQGGYQQAKGKIDLTEETSACWNWALTAYADDGLRPDWIFDGFRELQRVHGKERTPLERQPEDGELRSTLANYRDGTMALKDSQEMKALFNQISDRIITIYRTWVASALQAFDAIQAEQNGYDNPYYRDVVLPIMNNNIRSQNTTQAATLELVKLTVEANGFEMTENEDRQFYICMHEKKMNVGYEHWWIEDLEGNVMQKFPVNWIDQNDHQKGKKGQEITYQNFNETNQEHDFEYKIGIRDLQARHKTIILKDLNHILTSVL